MQLRATRLALAAGCAAAAALPAAAQNVRDTVNVDTTTPSGSTANGVSVASEGDISIITYNRDGNLYASTSDALGETWSTPSIIDGGAFPPNPFSGFQESQPTLYVCGNNVYTTWRDTRNGALDDMFFSRSLDGGATFQTPIRLDKGVPVSPNLNDVREWAMCVEPDAGGDRIYVVIVAENGDGSDNLDPEDIVLVSSLDGGATFSSALAVSTLNGDGLTDVDSPVVCAEGLTVHVAWTDDRNASGDDVFYRRSDDGGLTWATAETLIDGSGAGVGDVDFELFMDCDGSTVGVAFVDDLVGADELHVATSLTNGAVWLDNMVGSYLPGAGNDVDFPVFIIDDDGTYITMWRDNRTAVDEVYSARSLDSGVTWQADVSVTADPYFFPRIVEGTDIVTVVHNSEPGVGLADTYAATFTRDNGATWKTDFIVSNNTGDTDFTEVAHNRTYGNQVSAWLADDIGTTNNVYAAGFRAQTLNPLGFVQPGTNQFALSDFSGNDPLVYVLVSMGQGNFTIPFGDGRTTGLLLDATLLSGLNNTIPFLAILNASGSGSTPLVGNVVPPGVTLFFTAVSFSLGPLDPAEITDVNEVLTQ